MSILIPLTYQGKVYRRAEIDDEDWELVRGYTWSWHKPSGRAKDSEGYAYVHVRANGKEAMVLMHRLIMGAQKGQVVTFRDRNSLNCSRDNLLIGTQGIATALAGRSTKNKSGFRGVRYRNGKYQGIVRHENKVHSSPQFDNAKQAADWAASKRIELHGKAAWETVPRNQKVAPQ